MSIDPNLINMMASTVRVRNLVSSNDYGEPVYSTAFKSYPCHITFKPRKVIDSMGQEVVSDMQVWVGSTEMLQATAQFELVLSSTKTVTPDVKALEVHYDENGLHHTILYLGGVGG